MYYLLEDNRIIEGNEKDRVYTKEYPSDYIVKCKDGITTHGVIKNKSENVLELIDKPNDLVRVDNQIIMARTVTNIKNCFSINAIYKPDEKGNFKKVWEKK